MPLRAWDARTILSMNRRHFLATAAGVTGLALPSSAQKSPATAPTSGPVRLGVSSYSFWHFRAEKVSIETVIDETARMGAQGVDILHRQMDIEELAPLSPEMHLYCRKLKRHAFRAGIDLICLSIHQD